MASRSTVTRPRSTARRLARRATRLCSSWPALLDAFEGPEIRGGAVVRQADVDACVAQVAARHELEVVDIGKAAVALALRLEEAGVHAGEVGVCRGQSVLPAV